MPTIGLPDFDEMIKLIGKISDLTKQKLMLDAEISFAEAEITVEASKMVVNGKPPSMEYIKNSYLITGFNNELVEKRKAIIELIAELDKAKLMLQVYRDLIDVYRTESANERAMTPF